MLQKINITQNNWTGKLRKIHDIKRRAKKIVEKKSQIDLIIPQKEFKGDDFWGYYKPQAGDAKFPKKDYSKYYAVLTVITISLSLAMITFGRAYTVKAEMEADSTKAKE